LTHEGSASVTGSAIAVANGRILARAAAAATGSAVSATNGRIRARAASTPIGSAIAVSHGRVLVRGASGVTGAAVATASGRFYARGSVTATGKAVATATAKITHYVLAHLAGRATVSASASIRLLASASITGRATASALGGSLFYVDATDSWVLTSTAAIGLAAPGTLPAMSRGFYRGLESLVPVEALSCGMRGDPAVSNKVTVTGDSSLALLPGYSGVLYSLGGPPDALSSPIRLGFKRGDRLKLIGPTGSEPNHNKELTFDDPSTFSVMETLVTPDATEYEFIALRRSL
jgi:hypothetical protein